MPLEYKYSPTKRSRAFGAVFGWWLLLALAIPASALAVPAFARQTGQNCVACHAGGQFPELTAYGRVFKLTGYTIGTRAMPLAVMGVAVYNKTHNVVKGTDGVNAGSSVLPKENSIAFATGSVFIAGKVTDNLGGFIQISYDNYDSQDPVTGKWHGRSRADNVDIRYADRFIDEKKDLIVGLSLNNNPTVQDVWNSAPAWTSPYVPNIGRADAATNAGSTPTIYNLGANVAGLGAYAYWNRTVYTEISLYQAADRGIKSIFSSGTSLSNLTRLKGTSPYWRIALTHDRGPHSGMIGAFGMVNRIFNDPLDPTVPADHFSDLGVDAQYQYILDRHTVTVMATHVNEKIRYASFKWDPADPNFTGESSNASDTVRHTRLKASYVYQAKYGASLAYYTTSGSTNPLRYDPGALGLPGNLGSRIWVPEVFWTPVQYARLGVQFWRYSKLAGGSTNYAGDGRDAKDNNTMFIYLWAAY